MLAEADFLFVVDRAPLVAVDLVLVRSGREVLLGCRNNRPAQGFWFAPGGRIRKGEPMRDALLRVADTELGLGELIRDKTLRPELLGAFEHFYADCFAGECGVSTHYVVLGHRLRVPDDFVPPAIDAQHADLRWWPIDAALASDAVHRFTKDYLLLKGL